MALTQDDFINIASDQFPTTLSGQEQNIRSVFQKPDLSPQEEDELRRLNDRYNRLQPLELQGPRGSSRIRGNPYSYDINPLIEGAQNLVEGIVNRVRKKRLQADPEAGAQAENKMKAAQQRINMIKYGNASPDNKNMRRALSKEEQQEIESLNQDIEKYGRQVRDSKGVTEPRAALLKKQQAHQQGQQDIMDYMRDVSPKVAQTYLDMGQEDAKQKGQQVQDQKQAKFEHGLTQDEIKKRHKATMEEIEMRNKGGNGSGNEPLPAGLLSTLSENVGAMQQTVRGDLNSLRTERLRLNRAQDDPELKKTMEDRLGDKKINERLSEIDSEMKLKQTRLNNSVNELIRISARRNNLPESTIRKLLGVNETNGDDAGGDNGSSGGSNGTDAGNRGEQTKEPKIMTQDDLQEYAESEYGGDIEKARSFLESKGFSLKE